MTNAQIQQSILYKNGDGKCPLAWANRECRH